MFVGNEACQPKTVISVFTIFPGVGSSLHYNFRPCLCYPPLLYQGYCHRKTRSFIWDGNVLHSENCDDKRNTPCVISLKQAVNRHGQGRLHFREYLYYSLSASARRFLSHHPDKKLLLARTDIQKTLSEPMKKDEKSSGLPRLQLQISQALFEHPFPDCTAGSNFP